MTARPFLSSLTASILLLGASALLILRPLARFWSGNENYFYGWGVPFLAAYLFYERWRTRPAPSAGTADERAHLSLTLVILAWALVILASRLIIETEPASRPLLWLDGSLLAGALLAWAALLGGRPWLRHFAFPAAFLLVSVPWIFRCEFYTTQALMRLNAALVAGTLPLLDIPAHASGNTIVLPDGHLGVSEACSGIRSLQAALMMALFLGEFYRYRWRGRAGLLADGTALALLGNFGRMLYLAWHGARDGVASVESLHDSAGFIILVLTVASLWLVCLATRPPPNIVPRRAISEPPSVNQKEAWTWALGVFVATLLTEDATQAWYGWREQSAPHYPEWTVAWPQNALGFKPAPIADSTLDELHASTASGAEWRDSLGQNWRGLWIRYRAGAEGKVVFESHNPALCLPAAGWRALPDEKSFAMDVGSIHLAVEGRTFSTGATTEHVFWVPYLDEGMHAGADDGPGIYGHGLAMAERGKFPWLADVWRGCRGANAETLEVAVVGPAQLEQAEAAFRDILPRLIRPDAPTRPTLVTGER